MLPAEVLGAVSGHLPGQTVKNSTRFNQVGGSGLFPNVGIALGRVRGSWQEGQFCKGSSRWKDAL